jgi:hypothetical protein
MGKLEEAATTFEKAYRIKPEIWGNDIWRAATYGALGREKDARAALETFKKGLGLEPYLPSLMFNFPFKDRAVAERFAEGLIKAGIKAPPWRYFPAFKENQLTGEEIKRLRFGAKITGIDRDGLQWWMDCKKNGEFTWRGPGPISSDTGKTWIEGDMMCLQYQNRLWGLDYCSTVFRNPKGTYEGKDEYVSCSDWGFSPWSVGR